MQSVPGRTDETEGSTGYLRSYGDGWTVHSGQIVFLEGIPFIILKMYDMIKFGL